MSKSCASILILRPRDVNLLSADYRWRVSCEERQLLAFHAGAISALQAPYLDLQVDARVATRQIAYLPHAPLVPARLRSATAAADCFFERRSRVMTRAFGSPKMPRTVCCGRTPGNVYASHSRRCRLLEFAIPRSCQNSAPKETPETQCSCGSWAIYAAISPTRFREEPKTKAARLTGRPSVPRHCGQTRVPVYFFVSAVLAPGMSFDFSPLTGWPLSRLIAC